MLVRGVFAGIKENKFMKFKNSQQWTINYFVIINVGHTSIMRIVILKHLNVQDKILNVSIKHSVIGIVHVCQ